MKFFFYQNSRKTIINDNKLFDKQTLNGWRSNSNSKQFWFKWVFLNKIVLMRYKKKSYPIKKTGFILNLFMNKFRLICFH